MTERIDRAKRDVADARDQLIETARELQQRLAPKTLARDAWENAKNKGADLAEEAVDAVKNRPLAVGGAIAALTMFLARDPIKDGVSNFYQAMNQRKKATKAPAKRNAAPAPKVEAAKTPARPAAKRPARKAVATKVEKKS